MMAASVIVAFNMLKMFFKSLGQGSLQTETNQSFKQCKKPPYVDNVTEMPY